MEGLEPPAEAIELLANPVELVKWLEQQDPRVGKSYAVFLFEKLLKDAAQPKSVSGHACVRLCGLVDQASKSLTSDLKQWAFSQDVTLTLFNFYIEWNESDNHRSMKLVLDLVAQLLQKNPNKEEVSKIKKGITNNLVLIVIGRSTKPVAKSAIKTLDHFLSKDVINLDDIKSTYASFRPELNSQDSVEVWRNIMAHLLHWMRLHFVCPAAGRLVVIMYRYWRQGRHEGVVPSIDAWHQWLLDFLAEEPALLESIKNYIFLPLFKLDRSEALKFLSRMNEDQAVSGASDMNMAVPALLQLAALETGKRVGLVEEPAFGDSDAESGNMSSVILHEKVLESVLGHPSHDVRSLAISLLVTSPSTTRPYSSTAFDLLKKHLSNFFADPDAKFRVDISANARDMFKRVRGAIHVLKRSIPRAKARAQKQTVPVISDQDVQSQPILYRSNLISLPEAQLTYCLDYHIKFLHWYIAFLCDELTPTTSYQRHIAALKALMYIIRMEGQDSKTWETVDDQSLFFDRFDDKWARVLFDLIMDPFEDVRDLSATILARCYADGRYRRLNLTGLETSKVPVSEIRDLSQCANELACRTARADHSDGASKASQLLYRFLGSGEERLKMLSKMVQELCRKTSRAESDLGQAVAGAPLHGDFASLCHTWQVVSEIRFSAPELEDARKLQLEIVMCCERAWTAVRDILCDDSPEGLLPQELEDVGGLDTKDLLSYSFRAIHESRGAFTTVSSTFATCCQQTKHLRVEEAEKPLLEIWYEGTVNAIHTQGSTTRRSAGIPSMITGILAANAAQPTFDQVMDMLMTVAAKTARVSETDGSNLPQVHAYNCLKDIFKNSLLSSLGNKSESYLPQCLELAASGLRSEVWAIRNCGLIFLRSLIDNLFGTHESKAMIEAGWDGKASRIHYHRYPNLPAVLKNLLQSGHRILAESATAAAAAAGGSAAESVFPALDIIRRAGPPDLLRDEIQVHVAAYLSSPVWHVREMAARTLCSCLLHKEWLADIRSIFQSVTACQSNNKQNHIHGVLLTLKFVIERLNEVAHGQLLGDLEELSTFVSQTQVDALFPNSPDIVATFLDVINVTWTVQLTNNIPLSSYSVSIPSNVGSALLKIQKAIHDVYSISGVEDPIPKLRSLLLQNQDIGLDGLAAALGTTPKVWNLRSCSKDMLSSLCNLYIDICLETSYSEAQVLSIENLTSVMDELIAQRSVEKIPKDALVALWTEIPARTMNPALSNAVIRASGCIAAALSSPHGTSRIDIHAWGLITADAALDDKTFDTRFAAASSLRSFFAVHPSAKLPEQIPALITLYDSLNDDDDEVREVAAAAAKSIVGRALVPLEAAYRLLQFLTTNFGSSSIFRGVVVDRLVGHCGIRAATLTEGWEPAEVELSKSMLFDDSLFVVEEQNLFVDEVRETKRWVGVFEALEWSAKDESLAKLIDWLRGGVVQMGQLADVDDGPLGWASNPRVFAICARLIYTSVAVSKKTSCPELEQDMAISKLAFQSSNAQARVSHLFTEA
ncbi:hypothetical protein QQS21_006577 [Conoideocrella luteorostrata]|uniref:Death-receptor fusion protein-domain-containing protein n=1 Tax=Conoideocrella luteorostrata TaxID=1105319 RepID=A0AAJ0FSS7_9HYPO|nr:hypothetical protein QQS21_006577 [Conoideocrella luteorostrata]